MKIGGKRPLLGQCRAFKAAEGGVVYATATCANVDSLADYRVVISSPSGATVGAEADATCAEGYEITGCMCNSPVGPCNGAQFVEPRTCRAFNSATGAGVMASAICVQLGQLFITTTTPAPPIVGAYAITVAGQRSPVYDDGKSTATCPGGFVLTGCSCYADDLSCEGAYGENSVCGAYNTAGGTGVFAQARCAKDVVDQGTVSKDVLSALSGFADESWTEATCPSGKVGNVSSETCE